MDLTGEQIFIALDMLFFIVVLYCITKLCLVLYKMVTDNLEQHDCSDVVDRKFEGQKKFISQTLEKHKIQTFELIQNANKAQEIRIKKFINEQNNKKENEED